MTLLILWLLVIPVGLFLGWALVWLADRMPLE
jgi:hypothetical protein